MLPCVSTMKRETEGVIADMSTSVYLKRTIALLVHEVHIYTLYIHTHTSVSKQPAMIGIQSVDIAESSYIIASRKYRALNFIRLCYSVTQLYSTRDRKFPGFKPSLTALQDTHYMNDPVDI